MKNFKRTILKPTGSQPVMGTVLLINECYMYTCTCLSPAQATTTKLIASRAVVHGISHHAWNLLLLNSIHNPHKACCPNGASLSACK